MQTIQDAKILVVDDNRELRNLIKEELTGAGYRAVLIGVVLHYGAKSQQEGFFPVGEFGRRLCPRPGHGMAEAFCVGDAAGG